MGRDSGQHLGRDSGQCLGRNAGQYLGRSPGQTLGGTVASVWVGSPGDGDMGIRGTMTHMGSGG